MPHCLTCPHCSTALRLPETGTSAVVICPRCLGQLPNPELPESSTAIQTSPALPLMAIDVEEVSSDVRPTTRSQWNIPGQVFKSLFFAILITAFVAPMPRMLGVNGVPGGLIFIGSFFALLVIPRFWGQIKRLWILHETDPIGFDRDIRIALLWIIAMILALAAVFVILVMTCK